MQRPKRIWLAGHILFSINECFHIVVGTHSGSDQRIHHKGADMDKFLARINQYRELVNQNIKQVSNKKNPASFYEPVQYILGGDGKRIRPILVILSCEAVGGRAEDSIDAALAVEILHNFTLVHDDIMDHDDLRRGRQTVHKKWDDATAILAGDGLVGLAYQYLLKSSSPHIKEICDIFTSGIIELCEGQALDKEFEKRFDIDLNQYMEMILKKTAILLMTASEIGAIIGGADKESREILVEFSKQLGLAFQIQDDLIDIELTSGKTYGSDIKQKKKTYLFVHALNNASPSMRNRLIEIYNKQTISDQDIEIVRELFEQSGTLKFSRNVVDAGIETAHQELKKLPPSTARPDLSMLLDMILNRTS